MNLTEQWKKYLEEIADPENIDVSSFEVKEDLHPGLWDSWDSSYLLDDEIGDRLYEIAKEFFKSLDV